jgi:histidine phosphotransferase ChpT
MNQDLLGLGRLQMARICHDLGGIAGTLGGTLDLLGGDDPALLDLLRESAQTLRRRLRLYAAAWGGGAEAMDAGRLRELLLGAPAVPRVTFDLDNVAPEGAVPAALVPLVLNAALLGSEALPRGGTVRLSGDPGRGFAVLPEGRNAAWPPGLLRILAGNDPRALLEEGGPRRILAPLVVMLAAEAGWTASLALGGPGAEGAAPLMLIPDG